MGKFGTNVIAEAAYRLAGHGFCDEYGNSSEGNGWNALVELSPVLLRNVGETDLADRLERVAGTIERTVWLYESTDGTVYSSDNINTLGRQALRDRFDRLYYEHNSEQYAPEEAL